MVIASATAQTGSKCGTSKLFPETKSNGIANYFRVVEEGHRYKSMMVTNQASMSTTLDLACQQTCFAAL